MNGQLFIFKSLPTQAEQKKSTKVGENLGNK